jgi:hypothetical protein
MKRFTQFSIFNIWSWWWFGYYLGLWDEGWIVSYEEWICRLFGGC